MQDDVIIRRAVEADLPGLVRLLAEDPLGAGRETPDGLAPYRTAFAAIEADPNQLLVVMERAGVLVGTLQLTLIPGLSRRGSSRAKVEAVRVASSERGAGLGGQLMAWVEEQARAWGCAVIELTSDASRTDAHRFYERLGYHPSHVGFKKPVTRGWTAHERSHGEEWDASYTGDEPAPWEIGGPQAAVRRLVAGGRLAGPVLDVGCGGGENALLIASLGVAVVGIDVAGTALSQARAKAVERGVAAEFVEFDALRLADFGRRFATVLDCGLFHNLDAAERVRYVHGLATVTEPGGVLYLLCFSDEGPNTGPHPVTRAELAVSFDIGWHVNQIERSVIHTNFHDENGGPAWLATVARV